MLFLFRKFKFGPRVIIYRQGASEAYLLRVSWGARMKWFETGGVTGRKVWMLEKINIEQKICIIYINNH